MVSMTMFATKVSRARSYFLEHGAMKTLHLIHYVLSEHYHDTRLGIRTVGAVRDLTTVGVHDEDSVHYFPTPYAALLKAMRRVDVKPEDVFVDYGCGWGRVVATATRLPFKRVIGLDLVGEFVERAGENVERSRKRAHCRNVELLVENAAHYRLPDDATVLHFYNPFRGDTLDQVVANLEASLVRRPRPVTVLFANPEHFERAIAGKEWIRPVGDDVRFSGHFEALRRDDNCYRIYTCSAPA